MKQSIVLMLALAFGLAGLRAQSYFGARLGTTIANVEETRDGVEIETESKANFQVGALLELGVLEWLAIQPEVAYTGYTTGFEILGVETERSLSYLDFGALVKLRTNPENPIGGYIGVGPYFNYILDGQVKVGDVESDLDFGDDEFKRTDLSIVSALGVSFNIGGPVLFVDGRYILGLGDLDDSEDREVKNRAIGIGVGITVPIN